MSGEFVHLHTHSEYSLLDGLGRIKDLVKEAKRLGQPALAITDHGVMHGAVEFFRACRSAEIKPIIGIEAYQTLWGRPMAGRDPQLDKENYHLLLLARDMTGYQNLLQIASRSQLEGFYYKPRVDHDFLAAHAQGLICSTGCLGAEVPQLLAQGREREAYERLGWYVEVFGKENFFVELQDHNIPELVQVNRLLAPWADRFGLQLVATNDVHYVREADGGPHDVLLCVQTGALVTDAKRMRLSDGSYFLKSREQMEATFRPLVDLPASAFDHTLRIAEMCDVNLEDPAYHLPNLAVPPGHTYETYLRHLTEEGLVRLYGDRAGDPELQERKERELRIIHEMGFDVYFLIVADLCNFARSRNIWWNVRGSGAGSLVAYCTGITGIDPIKNNLIFERFLNPGRVTMPDFDLDFPDDQREEMIRYTVQKFGEEQVAQIVTFGRMKARAAIRDVGRVKDVPLSDVDRIAKMIPAIPGKPATIHDVLDPENEFYNAELVELYNQQPWARELLDTSMQLEGVARHAGIHAAAVIVADRELTHYAPLMRGTKATITSTIAQFEFPILESIGLLKVDFLGLSTLSVMREAARLIRERHGRILDLSTIPFEGEVAAEAFKLLSSGEVSGVFQVESQGMRRVLTEMRPSAFEHIVATISLYRPGPMEYIPNFIRRMHGEEAVAYQHPRLETILGETYGICVSGDAVVADARTGQRCRLDQVGQMDEMVIQGVDSELRPAIGRVTHWIDSGVKPVYRVRLRNGMHIKVTADHRLLSEDGWRPLNELAAGDFVAVPRKLLGPDEAEPTDRRKLRVLAYLIADGSLSSMASVDFVSKDPALIGEHVCCLAAFPDVRPVFTEQVHGVTRVGIAKQRDHGVHYHAPTSLLTWMRSLGLKHGAGSSPGGLRSHEKFVPPYVYRLGEADIAFFLASLWECDGHMGRKICHYRTVSARLAEDVQILLLRLGIRSVIHRSRYHVGAASERGGEERESYQVTVYDTARLASLLQPHMVSTKRQVVCTGKSAPTVQRQRFLSEVRTATRLSARGLMRTYGLDRQHFARARRDSQRISAAVVERIAEQVELPCTAPQLNVDWQEIAAIEFVGDEHVYDLTVEGLHSFVANNVIVHNCVYQEQIIQILSQLAGYTPGDADLVRRAISKKKASDIEYHKAGFVKGCTERGIPEETASAIYGDIEFFARYGFNKCLPGDVEVVDAATGRLVRVDDLYHGRVTLEAVVTCDTASLRLGHGSVADVIANGVKPVYRLQTALGRQIEATANHPFYTFDGWRTLEELAVDDMIAVPRCLPVEGNTEWLDHEVIALGHLLAEGNLCHPQSVYLYSQDPAQVADYVRAAEQFDNVACSAASHKDTHAIYAKRVNRGRPAGIVTWANDLGIRHRRAHEKEIPGAVFTLTNRQVGLLISRMWEGDGHIDTKGRSLFYATASERMARQLQHLLLRLGIISRLRTVVFPYKDGRTGYQLFVTGNDNLVRFHGRIAAHFVSEARRNQLASMCLAQPMSTGTKDVVPVAVKELVRAAKAQHGATWTEIQGSIGIAQREFYPTGAASKRGFARPAIQRLADYFDSDELRRYGESDIYWDRVVAVEYVGEKPTYDLEVPATHNFVANDILVHNSHAADYAVITVQTAYLKAHYPVEYMAALLLVERDKTEKVVNFINECRRMGVDVLPPDINYSGLDFEIQARPADTPTSAHRDPQLGYPFPVPDGSAIRFGMAAVKNVGEGPVQAILAVRREGGPFASLEDLCERVDLRQVNKRALECLVKVGALDRFGQRSQLLAVLDELVARSASVHSARESGQLSMFDLFADMPAADTAPIRLPEMDEVKGRERLQWEKELLGVYAMSHPLQQLSVDLRNVVTCGCSELDERYDGRNIVMAGMISSVRTITTKKGEPMAFVQLEDLQGQCEVVFFPRTYAETRDKLVVDSVVVIKGKAQSREGQTSLLADSVQNYVEQHFGAENGDEAYQKRLIDLAPTVNGLSAPIDEAEKDDDAGAVDEDGVPAPAEENPFQAEMPAWMQEVAEVTGANGSSQPAEVASERQAIAMPGQPQQHEPAHPAAEPAAVPIAATRTLPAAEPATASHAPLAMEEAAPASAAVMPELPVAGAPPPPVPAPAAAGNGLPPRVQNGGRGQPPDGQRRRLYITFRRSGDLDRDKYRLKEIYDRVRDPYGRDRFYILLEAGGKRYELAFPNDACSISERLTSELVKHFRTEVTVQEGEARE